MTFRSASRVAAVVALSLVFALVSFAAPPKRRVVNPAGPKTQAVLTGTVTDAATGAALPHVLVSSGDNSLATTDSSGKFTVKIPLDKDVSITFTRSGYETLTSTVHLSDDGSQSFRLTSKPTVKVKLTNGATVEVDTESVEFGYLAPFTGYTKDSKLNLCTAGGNQFQPDRTEIRRITTGVQLNDPVCCDKGSIPAISVELKNGTTTTGGFLDACFGYKSDLIALDHKTGDAAYIHFSDISEVTFP